MKKDLIFWVIAIILVSSCLELRQEMRYKKFVRETVQKMENLQAIGDTTFSEQVFQRQTELLARQVEISNKLATNQKLICYAILGDGYLMNPEKAKKVLGEKNGETR